jgi:tRNA modification GTPase
LYWPDSRSYTGQPTVEIHTIGSPPILNAIVEDLARRGARVAGPGEFTLRAFLSGKIDLVQAEAVLGVIDADSTSQLQQALTQLAGGVSTRIRELREQLLIDLADLEAGLDFVEEDIEFVDRDAMTARLQRAVDWLEQLEEHSRSRGRTTGRKTIVLAGLPNAGKSTLFNALARREAAIVSPAAGTTRDWLTATIDLGDLMVDLVDTAGAEQGGDEISQQAQALRSERMQQADLVLWCSAADATPQERAVDHDLSNQLVRLNAQKGRAGRIVMPVLTKSDQTSADADDRCAVSALHGAGLQELKSHLREWLTESGDEGDLLSSTLARCGESLSLSLEALARAAEFSAQRGGEELVAFELRRGLEALGQIAGVVYTDDLLDRIFSRFCIGK